MGYTACVHAVFRRWVGFGFSGHHGMRAAPVNSRSRRVQKLTALEIEHLNHPLATLVLGILDQDMRNGTRVFLPAYININT